MEFHAVYDYMIYVCSALREIHVHLQALFNSLPPEDYKDGLLVLGGDGRYFNREAAQVYLF